MSTGTTAGGSGVYHTPLRASSKPNGQSSEDGTTNSGEIINFEIQEFYLTALIMLFP